MEKLNKKPSAIVLFSGGQDSTTLLGWAKNRYNKVYALSFNYGQRHLIELEQSKEICKEMNIEHLISDISQFATLVDSNLTNAESDINQSHERLEHLPSAYVPNRNAILLTLAHSYAQKLGVDTIVAGMNQTDYAGYPDCRHEFVSMLEETLKTGSDTHIKIETPLIFKEKYEIWKMGQDEGVMNIIKELSHTCYNGLRDHKRDDGYGCTHVIEGEIATECPSCKVRRESYEKYIEIFGKHE